MMFSLRKLLFALAIMAATVNNANSTLDDLADALRILRNVLSGEDIVDIQGVV